MCGNGTRTAQFGFVAFQPTDLFRAILPFAWIFDLPLRIFATLFGRAPDAGWDRLDHLLGTEAAPFHSLVNSGAGDIGRGTAHVVADCDGNQVREVVSRDINPRHRCGPGRDAHR